MKRLLLALAMAAAGCGTAPKEQYYTLAFPVAGAAPEAIASPAAPVSVFVGPVSVPESVDRSPMVLRTSPTQVDIDDFHRWAEPLKSAIPRVLAESLTRELGSPRVMASRAASSMPFDYRVAVEIQRFESSLAEGAALDALWTVTPDKGAPRTGRSVLREPNGSGDRAGVAAAHGRALQRMAKEIAEAVKRGPGPLPR